MWWKYDTGLGGGEKGRDVVHRDTGKFHGTRPVLNWLSKSALDLHQYKDGLGVTA